MESVVWPSCSEPPLLLKSKKKEDEMLEEPSLLWIACVSTSQLENSTVCLGLGTSAFRKFQQVKRQIWEEPEDSEIRREILKENTVTSEKRQWLI